MIEPPAYQVQPSIHGSVMGVSHRRGSIASQENQDVPIQTGGIGLRRYVVQRLHDPLRSLLLVPSSGADNPIGRMKSTPIQTLGFQKDRTIRPDGTLPRRTIIKNLHPAPPTRTIPQKVRQCPADRNVVGRLMPWLTFDLFIKPSQGVIRTKAQAHP